MKTSSWGGMTRAEHDSIPHTAQMLAEACITTSKLANSSATVEKVAYPVFDILQNRTFYEAGDKSIVLSSLASYCAPDDVFVCELEAESGSVLFKKLSESYIPTATKTVVNPVTNESNISDGDLGTYAQPASDLSPLETREMVRWDFGTSALRSVVCRLYGATANMQVRLDASDNGTDWAILMSKSAGDATDVFNATFRYLRWVCRNLSDASQLASGFRIYELQVFSPMEAYNTFSRTNTATQRNDRIFLGYKGSSALTLAVYLFRKIWR